MIAKIKDIAITLLVLSVTLWGWILILDALAKSAGVGAIPHAVGF